MHHKCTVLYFDIFFYEKFNYVTSVVLHFEGQNSFYINLQCVDLTLLSVHNINLLFIENVL